MAYERKSLLGYSRLVTGSLGVLVAAMSIAVTGCGASAPVGSGSTPTTTATPTSTTTASSTCPISSLSLSFVRGGVATGHVSGEYQLTNIGGSACTLQGYPALHLLDAQGHPLPTQENQTTSAFTFQAQPPQPISLAHGQSAYLYTDYTFVSSPGQTCVTTAAAMTVTPPGDSASLQTSTAPDPCGPINISPLQAQPLGG